MRPTQVIKTVEMNFSISPNSGSGQFEIANMENAKEVGRRPAFQLDHGSTKPLTRPCRFKTRAQQAAGVGTNFPFGGAQVLMFDLIRGM